MSTLAANNDSEFVIFTSDTVFAWTCEAQPGYNTTPPFQVDTNNHKVGVWQTCPAISSVWSYLCQECYDMTMLHYPGGVTVGEWKKRKADNAYFIDKENTNAKK
jgi:hypothetical protein